METCHLNRQEILDLPVLEFHTLVRRIEQRQEALREAQD